MKNSISALIFTAATGLLSANSVETSPDIVTLVKNASSQNKADVAAIVSKQILANPNLACEIVKGAVVGSNADAASVAAIVEAAMIAAPEQMTAIPKSALIIAPDSTEEVSSVVRKYVAVQATTDDNDNNPLDGPLGAADTRPLNEVGQRAGEGSSTAGPNGVSSAVADKNGGSGAANSNMGNSAPVGGVGNIVTPPVSTVQPL